MPDALDTFTGIDGTAINLHTADTGQAWYLTPRNSVAATIAGGNHLTPSVTTECEAYLAWDPPTANYAVKFKLTPRTVPILGVGYYVLIARMPTSVYDGYFLLVVYNTAGNGGCFVRIVKKVGGTQTTLAGQSDHAFTPVQDVQESYEWRCVGSTISAYRNGSLICSTPLTDTSVAAAGFPGLFVLDAARHADIDDFEAVALVASADDVVPLHHRLSPLGVNSYGLKP